MSTTRNQKVIRMVELAMLIALIFVMQYLGTLASTPLRTIGIEFSFVLIPIVVGAFLLGPVEGAILGFVFGAMTVVLTVIAPGTM
ncbi:MAG: ECF transporter S component, partial [Clostridia bacterium]|nr:ECF transporter S component [Clostridia bacterium]